MFAYLCGLYQRIDDCIEKLPRRRFVFVYDILWIVLLGVIAWVLTQKNNCVLPTVSKVDWSKVGTYCILWIKYKFFFNAMWFGALGGIAISLKGVYDHGARNDPWKNDYNLWHLGRPASGAIAGMIAALLLYLIVPTASLSPLVAYGVAFVFGTQDRAFFDFLSSFAGRFLPAKTETTPVLNVSGVHPGEGKAGDTIRIAGQAIDKAVIARIGGVKIAAPTIAPDGTSISGAVPKLGLAAGTKVDLEVINPGGRSIVLLEGFKYLGD